MAAARPHPHTMPDIRLIASDLDGTLLNSKKQLSDANAKALFDAAQRGIEIVPATGRFYGGMPACIRELPYVHYVITINGASVYDIKKGVSILKAEFSWEKAIGIMKILDGYPVIYDCFMDNWGWMTKSMQDKADSFATGNSLDMIYALRKPVPDLKEYLEKTKHSVQKIQMFFQSKELRLAAMDEITRVFEDMSVTSSIPNNIELNSKEATKGNALRALAEYLHMDLSETVAFGDDLNDISMLQNAGIGIAMANAPEFVKEAADDTTLSCDEDGVAAALNKLFREG